MTTTHALPDDLAALLAAHGIAPTTDALLAELIDGCGLWLYLSGPDRTRVSAQNHWEARIASDNDEVRKIGRGPTPLTALARAYQAMVKEER